MDTLPGPPPPGHRVSFNVGGSLFETTTATLSAAPDSLLATLHHHHHNHPIFIDRNPDIFPSFLSLLRSRRLPSAASHAFPAHHLLRESLFYGLNPLLEPSLSPPPLLPFDASLSHFLCPPSDPLVSSLSAIDDYCFLLLAHGGQISSYGISTLVRSSTFRTHLDDISSIRQVSPDIAAVGSDSSAGLHFYSLSAGKHAGEALWWDPYDPRTHKARVTAVDVDSTGDSVFASFECQHRENAILIVDKTTMKVVAEIGRQSGNAAKSAAVRKLTWTPALGLLVGSSVTCGAFGYSGLIRIWDPRTGGEAVWETSEPGGLTRISRVGDSMADVDVDPEGLFLAKVGSRSGDLGVADMRKLGPDPWVYLQDPNPALGGAEPCGRSVVVHCYKKHVFVGKEGGLEAWSRVEQKELRGENEMGRDGGEEREWGVYRRNYVDKVDDAERGLIWKIQGGGNRLFVCRENVEGVEVWESSAVSGVKMVL